MGKSILKHRSWERILTLVLVFAMLAAYVPAVGVAKAAEPSAAGTYVLDVAKEFTEFGAGEKAVGNTTEVDGYFTVLWSEKSKVDASSKNWDDGYSSGLRINSSEKAQLDRGSIMFKTAGPATVKVWWAKNGDDARQIVILDSAGETVDITTGEHTKNSAYLDTLTIDKAGTYYLGGDTGGNYIFKVEVTEAPASSTYVLDAEKELAAFAAGEKAVGDTMEVAGFFTILWSEKSKVDASSKSWDDGYSSGQRINFGGKATTESNSIMFKTAGPATVKIWWASNERNMAILNSAGEIVAVTDDGAVKNQAYLSTLTLTEGGTYYLGGDTGSNYIFKVEVTTGGGAVERAPWAEVAAPVITEAKQNKKNIDVTVSALIGTDGADKVTVTMTKPDGSTESKDSLAEKDEHTISFAPASSGKYTFSVTAVRDGEETEHKGAEEKTVEFVLPLTTPVIKSVTNNGGGKITLDWNPVAEAETYKVTVQGTNKSVETKELTAAFEGLTIGETYTIEVVAICAGRDSSSAGTVEHTVIDREERTWVFATFGTSTSTSKNGYSGSVYGDDGVTVWSEGNGGKLVPNSTDGVAFYYTAIPTTMNFRLTANIHVDSWTYSNGQDGFGLMVSDRVGASGAGADFWNNSYMAVITKVEYYWDDDLKEVTDSGRKYTMRLGVGAQEKINVTPDNIGASNLASEIFSSTMTTLNTTAGGLGLEAGDYNLAGNYTVEPGYPAAGELLTDFKLTIERNPTGYFVSYEDADGNVTTRKYYDPDALSHLDEDYVYAGFFAARNARITVTDIELTTVAVKDDDREVEERPINSVTPSYTIESASIANSEKYDLVYYGNADGTLVVKAADGTELFNGHVTANTKQHIQAALALGANTFTWTMTPDKDYHPNDDEYKVLSSYDPVSDTHTVTYAVHDRDVIYVSPSGVATAKGSKDDPMDIYEAVKKVVPGQTIILLEGTYNLTRTVVVERGINGTEDAYITMTADPNAAARPVLDFGGNCAGMILAGDYWHFYGFDVTRSANGQKGIQVSGSHNILERLLTYKNGNTGLQISRYKGSDLFEDWPADNLILNCSSYLNSDSGYEDADGFAAKLTIGNGNVFDGCIAAYNADDGWDLYAKVETGSIGAVTIKNSVAFCNGWLWNEDGWWTKDSSPLVNAGNGNGFKMGGESLPGGHTLINSVSFGNKAKGFDSNSCPDIKVYNSTSFNNNSYNVAFYTNSATQTNYAADGIISYKNNGNTTGEQFKVKGTQKEADLKGPTNYYYDGSVSANTEGIQVTDDWFIHVDMDRAINDRETGIGRNADGSINMNGFLVLTNKAPADAGARLVASEWVNPFTDVSESDWFYDELAYAVEHGLIHGDGAGKFNPGTPLTRGMMVTILYNLEGKPPVTSSFTFADVPAGQYYADAVAWTAANKIAEGYGDNTFGPDDKITREQFATILWRYADGPEVTGSLDAYSDASDVNDWATIAMVWAVQNGIVQSTDGKLDPQGNVLRSEAVVMFTNFCKNIKK